MSFFKKLFGGGESAPEELATDTYKGLLIRATPVREGDQWRLAGEIMNASGDEDSKKAFLRADLFPSREQADTFSLRKGKQIIDERGEGFFAGNNGQSRV